MMDYPLNIFNIQTNLIWNAMTLFTILCKEVVLSWLLEKNQDLQSPNTTKIVLQKIWR